VRILPAAANSYERQSNDEQREYGGNVYEDSNGMYSYTAASPGPPCSEDQCTHDPNPSDIPDGTTLAGLYHTHPSIPGDDGTEVSLDDVNVARDLQVPEFVATNPTGRVVMFDYNRYGSWLITGSPVPMCVAAGSRLGLDRC
jgi:hypothetical protein